MEIHKRQVETLAWHDMDGIPEPYRVQYQLYNELVVHKIKMLRYIKRQLPDSTLYINYDCEAIGESQNNAISLEYDMGTGKWYLV